MLLLEKERERERERGGERTTFEILAVTSLLVHTILRLRLSPQ